MTPSRPLSPQIAGQRRVLRFSTATGIGVIAVTVMAVIALGMLLVPPGDTPPIAVVSLAATATATAEPETPSSEPSRTLTPTAQPTPIATPVPTLAPTPAPVLSSWTSLEWGEPFEPFPIGWGGIGRWHYVTHDLVQWNGAWVSAGEWSKVSSVCNEAAFKRSEDGVSWTGTGYFPSGWDYISVMCPDHLVAKPHGLIALGQRRLWASADGTAWQDGTSWREIDSPSWRSLWSSDIPELVDVAGGSAGIVAIGVDSETGQSVVAQSPDARVWHAVTLPASEQPVVRDVATYSGGFVIVGRDGLPDGEATSAHPAVVPGMGRAAVWTSSDGVTWTEAPVQADRVQGGGMTQLLVGSHGLFAIGINTGADYYPLGLQGSGEVVTAWTSPDGASWEVAGSLGENLPPMALMASDGTTMVGLGLRQAWVGQDPTAWASLDGQHWTSLAVSGPAPDVSYLVLEPQVPDGRISSGLWVLPDGLLAIGPGDGVPADQPYASQWFRFAEAATR